MDKKIFLMFGVVSIVVAYTLCLTHAADDYGIVKNCLSVNVLAQDTGNGGNGGGSTTDEGGITTDEGGDTTDESGNIVKKNYDITVWENKDCWTAIGEAEVKGKESTCYDGSTYVNCITCFVK